MNRIFYPLALLAVVAVAAVLVLGLYLHGFDLRNAADSSAQRLATVHRLSGIAAGVIVLLVDSVVITYFVGTSRWCKEVSETYRLGTDYVARSARLKRKTFPLAVVSMLTVVGIVALGGAADPANDLHPEPLQNLFGADFSWADAHLGAALAGTALLTFGFFAMSLNIATNQGVIQDVMAQVKRIRTERGLD